MIVSAYFRCISICVAGNHAIGSSRQSINILDAGFSIELDRMDVADDFINYPHYVQSTSRGKHCTVGGSSSLESAICASLGRDTPILINRVTLNFLGLSSASYAFVR